jgi:hypothetical protein
MTTRLLKIDRRPNLTVWTYWHPTRGIIHAIVGTHEPNVTHVGGPNFGAGERPRKEAPLPEHRKRKRRRAV